MNDKPAKPAIEMVTLKQLCAELRSIDVKRARGSDSRCAMLRKVRNSQNRTSRGTRGSGRRTHLL